MSIEKKEKFFNLNYAIDDYDSEIINLRRQLIDFIENGAKVNQVMEFKWWLINIWNKLNKKNNLKEKYN